MRAPGKRRAIGAVAVAATALTALTGLALANRALLRTPPDEVPRHRALIALARTEAALPFLRHCAACHGAAGRGDAAKGAPDLRDGRWLHGSSDVSEIERTILFGIRSGDPRARNVADMPAFAFEGRLTRPEIRAVTDYVLALGGRTYDPRLIPAGRSIYQVKGVCYDCHGISGAGVPDFGAPSFRTMNLIHGTDRNAIMTSIIQGRHGLCPAWIGKIGAATIRAMAVDLHESSTSAPR